jgi:hypothetical protein
LLVHMLLIGLPISFPRGDFQNDNTQSSVWIEGVSA